MFSLDILISYITAFAASPLVIAILGLLCAIVQIDKKRWEFFLPYMILSIVYLTIYLVPDTSDELRRFLVRWCIVILTTVEFFGWAVRKFYIKRQRTHERRIRTNNSRPG